MIAIGKNLLHLKAGELMSEALILIPREMSLRGAAHLLVQGQVSGAPVIDHVGHCVGVLSAADFVRWAEEGNYPPNASRSEYPYCASWQMLDIDGLPDDCVANYMTPDPVVTSKAAAIADLARMMVDAHIHRVIVVDASQRPIGIVSSTDILAAVAEAGR